MPKEDTPEDDFYSRIPVELNMGELRLDEHIKKGQGDRTAIHYLDKTFSYSWLKENANKTANAFEYLCLEIENRFMTRSTTARRFRATERRRRTNERRQEPARQKSAPIGSIRATVGRRRSTTDRQIPPQAPDTSPDDRLPPTAGPEQQL